MNNTKYENVELNGEELKKYIAERFPKEEKKEPVQEVYHAFPNGLSLNDPRVVAVSQSADVTPEEAFELLDNEDWICLTDEEADEMAREYILDSVWAFNSDFLAHHSDSGVQVFNILKEACEDANSAILTLIKDTDYFVEDAINADGRGHFMSSYDGEEYEENIDGEFWYCYRLN
ncbi:MAG: hypothetical protein Unbinned6224contig1001_18 [Prokaryotic dsDNA virus sp.]|nr:MAG: hypothetical protein Unbinned6224contig1001_18 [Prokaryotic dsDNA virus sp.]|tara:strand:+ start:670 stop:1194 length:525 start_codon:yes stop_codon:yes gene_type:complete